MRELEELLLLILVNVAIVLCLIDCLIWNVRK